MAGTGRRPGARPVPDDHVLMGRIGAAHGISGEVRIQSFTAHPADIAGYSPFETDRPGLTVTIEGVRLSKNVVIARLAEVIDRTAAERLNGVELYIPRDRLPPADTEDEFYHADLIGLDVRLTEGTSVGTVIAVPNYGAGDLLEIAAGGTSSQLYPFTRAIVPEIHVDKGYLVLVPPGETTAGEDE